MKKAILAPLALLALPAFAQSQRVALVFDQTKHQDTTLSTGGPATTLSTDNTTGLGIRYGFTAAHFGPTALEFEATYRPRGNEKFLKEDGMEVSYANTGGFQEIQMSEEYLAAGVGLSWTQVVDFGFILEVRQESMDLKLSEAGMSYTSRTATTRPWLRLHAGYTFPVSMPVKPFVSLGYDLALSKRQPSSGELTSPIVSSFAGDILSRTVLPKSQIELQAGIRF
ncbi:MAG TPA: hypothetical protein VFM16_04675 [Holophagaceae bacterium]|nr:hypothetical protein [Holophagaceae bacterium]